MRVFKAWPIYFIGRMLPAAIGFAGVAVYTRLLDPGSFGIYALLLSTSFLVGTTAYAWLRVAALRMLSSATEDDKPAYAASIGLAFVATSVPVVSLILGILLVYNHSLPLPLDFLAAGCAVASGWFELNVTVLQAGLKTIGYGLLQSGRAIVAVSVSIWLLVAGLKASALLIGFIAGNCAALFAIGLWLPALRGRPSVALIRRFWIFGWPSSAGSLSLLTTTFQRYLLALKWGAAAVGVYAASFDLSQQSIGLLIGTATLAGQPLAFRARDLGEESQLSSQMRHNAQLVVGVGFPAALALAVLATPLSRLYLGSGFRSDAATLIALAASVMFLAALRASYFEQAFEIAFHTSPLVYTTALRVVLSIVISFPMIYRFGTIGAALALLLTELLGLAVTVFWAMKVLRVPMPLESWAKTVAASAVMSFAIALVPSRETLLGFAASIVVGVVAYAIGSVALNLRGALSLAGTRMAPAREAFRP